MRAFTSGFWIDQHKQLAHEQDDDARYWIPPSQIKYIEKK
jgi:hypothetical protein